MQTENELKRNEVILDAGIYGKKSVSLDVNAVTREEQMREALLNALLFPPSLGGAVGVGVTTVGAGSLVTTVLIDMVGIAALSSLPFVPLALLCSVLSTPILIPLYLAYEYRKESKLLGASVSGRTLTFIMGVLLAL